MVLRAHMLAKMLLVAVAVIAATVSTGVAHADKSLVVASAGPSFSSPEEAIQILEGVVLPSFEYLAKLEADGKLVAGGLPVADRQFVFILDVESNAEADALLRAVPAWGLFTWNVTALQEMGDRLAMEREAVRKMKAGMR
jgi:hypothetical protein